MPNPPALRIVAAAPSKYWAVDSLDARFYILGSLGIGILRFEIVARLASGSRGRHSGREYFRAMMAHFGAAVRTIESNWNAASRLTANLDAFNNAVAAGIGWEAAAALTWTGLRASEYGFDRVAIVRANPSVLGNGFDEVRVQFTR